MIELGVMIVMVYVLIRAFQIITPKGSPYRWTIRILGLWFVYDLVKIYVALVH